MKRSVLKVLAITLGLSLPAAALAGPILPIFPQPVQAGDTDALLWLAQCGARGGGRSGGGGSESGGGESGGGSGGGGYGGGGDCAGEKTGVGGAALNKGTTNALVKIISRANSTCGSAKMAAQYRVDCLRIYYGWVADQLPDRGEYAPIKKAMRQAEAKLDRIVRANLDTQAPRIEPNEGYKPDAKRLPPIRAVKKSATKKAATQAEAVVKETELLIIRSGEDPSRRSQHYAAVAEAVDDNLVILRSA